MGLERERTYVEAQEAVGSDVDGHPAVGADELPEAGSMRHTIHDLIHESPSTLDSSANAANVSLARRTGGGGSGRMTRSGVSLSPRSIMWPRSVALRAYGEADRTERRV